MSARIGLFLENTDAELAQAPQAPPSPYSPLATFSYDTSVRFVRGKALVYNPIQKQEGRMQMLRKCIILAVTLAMIFSLSACDLVPTKAPTEPATPGTTPIPTEELEGIKITADELFEEYEENEIAADHNYKNHTLIIVGKITDISREPETNKAYVSAYEEVRCFFNNEDELLELAKGEEVIVKGKCLGKKEEKEGTSFPIVLRDCSLIEKTEFQVTDWKLAQRPTPSYWWGLEISFIKFGYSLSFSLINPEGAEIHALQDCGLVTVKGEAYFPLAGTPPPGQYRFLVRDSKENIVATEVFNFSGASPKVEVLDYQFGVTGIREDRHHPPWVPCLYQFSLKVKNTGDLPLCIGSVEVSNNGKSWVYWLWETISPGEQKIVNTGTSPTDLGLPFSSPGKQLVTLKFMESSSEFPIPKPVGSSEGCGRVIFSMKTTITVPEKPPVE